MKVEQVVNCSFDRWYTKFKHVTFKSEIIQITSDVLNYLRSDSTIILPKSCQAELDADMNNNKSEFSDDDSTDWSTQDDENIDDDDEKLVYQDFPDFDKQINSALSQFGKVFIKLNWSSPKDAYWALNKLSCDRLSDVYIQLRSSDFVNHDLTQPFADCEDCDTPENQELIKNFKYVLVIRDWININSSMEFRCFVHKNKLVGVSQRDCRSFYQVLVDNQDDILERIKQFYIQKIHGNFFDSSYVFDVCSGKKTIKLMDFNPFGATTDSLLYSWEELERFEENLEDSDSKLASGLELRIIENNYGIFTGQYSMYSQPKESLEVFLSGKTETASQSADDLAELIKKNINIQSTEDRQDLDKIEE